MTPEQFIFWLKGFVAGSNNFNLTPAGWQTLKDELEKIMVIKNEENENKLRDNSL
jgi:hypothetical protein